MAANNAILNRFPLRGNESQNDCTDVDLSLRRFFSPHRNIHAPSYLMTCVVVCKSIFTESKAARNTQAHEEIIFRSKRKNDDDVCICKTMHRGLVRLLHFICAVCPRSTIFSHLSPTRITTAEDESPPPVLFRHSYLKPVMSAGKCAKTTERVSSPYSSTDREENRRL